MQCQVERLSHDNATLQTVSNLSQSHSDRLLTEHIALQNTLKEKEQQIFSIRDKISRHSLPGDGVSRADCLSLSGVLSSRLWNSVAYPYLCDVVISTIPFIISG